MHSINRNANPEKCPIFVHYFDDIYASRLLQSIVHTSIGRNIHFLQVPYKSPDHIRESEMFFNRTEFEYVRKSFPRSRKGYLHMCHFINNIYRYPNTRIHEFDYLRVYDDEAGYNKTLPYDPSHHLSSIGVEFGAQFYEQRLKNGAPHAGHLATRTKLFEFLLLS